MDIYPLAHTLSQTITMRSTFIPYGLHIEKRGDFWYIHRSDAYGAFRKFPFIYVTVDGNWWIGRSVTSLQNNTHEKLHKWISNRNMPNFRYSRFVWRQSGITDVLGDPFRESDERLTTYFALSLECNYPVIQSIMFALNRFFI